MDEDLPFCQSTLLHCSSVRMEKLCWLQLEMEEDLLFPVEGGARCPGGGDATVEGRASYISPARQHRNIETAMYYGKRENLAERPFLSL